MTTGEAQDMVSDALKLGLSVTSRSLTGDRVRVGPQAVRRLNKQVAYEYSFSETCSHTSSRDADSIAKLAVRKAGRKIGSIARKKIEAFVKSAKNLTS